MSEVEEVRIRILRLCYLGCRHHPIRTTDPAVNKRPCPARRVQGQLKRQGYWASQSRGIVRTDAPLAVITPFYEKARKPRPGPTNGQSDSKPRRRVRRGLLA